MRIFSYGGGVQSTAVLVLASQGKVQYDHFVFANVGEDSEHPDTLRYFKDYAIPFAKDYGINLVEIENSTRKGKTETLRERLMGSKRGIHIPMRLGSGAPGYRTCTIDFKIKVIDRWAWDHRGEDNCLIAGLGISTDEIHRARTREPNKIYKGFVKILEYPLIDLRLSRSDCWKIIDESGLPVPQPSACYFCPFHSDSEWHRLRQNRPDLFWDTVKIEKHLSEKRQKDYGKDGAWMHDKLIPLDQAIQDQPFLFDLDNMNNCESGYCFT